MAKLYVVLYGGPVLKIDLSLVKKKLQALEAPEGGWVTRFAPSPTGYLHDGHGLAVRILQSLIESVSGKVFLRIEDHDFERYREHYESAIVEDLKKIGFLTPDMKIVNQRSRTGRYQAVFENLRERGLVYPCECSRKDIELRTGQREVYDSNCKNRNVDVSGKDVSWRFMVKNEIETWDDLFLGLVNSSPKIEIGDFVVKEKSGAWSYNFAVCVDDIDQGVNLVIRGEDILSSTSRQIQLMRAIQLGIDSIVYGHHRLVVDGELGVKLSKRNRSMRIEALRSFVIN